jgi:nicotinate-nucleotide adenylyltransferase
MKYPRQKFDTQANDYLGIPSDNNVKNNQMKKTALFFGSFNPVHIGHLILGNYIAEYTGVDKIRYIVSPQNPLKQRENLLEDSVRLEMLRRSVEGYSKFEVSDIEFSLPKPSYTFNTLSVLSVNEPDTEFILIMGADNLDIFPQWKNYQWIMDNYKIFVYPRLNAANKLPDYCRNITLLQAPVIEISSTFIRESVKEGKDVRFFIPKPVYEMIREKNLYL